MRRTLAIALLCLSVQFAAWSANAMDCPVRGDSEAISRSQRNANAPINESPIAFQTIDGMWGPLHFCWVADWGDIPLSRSGEHASEHN